MESRVVHACCRAFWATHTRRTLVQPMRSCGKLLPRKCGVCPTPSTPMRRTKCPGPSQGSRVTTPRLGNVCPADWLKACSPRLLLKVMRLVFTFTWILIGKALQAEGHAETNLNALCIALYLAEVLRWYRLFSGPLNPCSDLVDDRPIWNNCFAVV